MAKTRIDDGKETRRLPVGRLFKVTSSVSTSAKTDPLELSADVELDHPNNPLDRKPHRLLVSLRCYPRLLARDSRLGPKDGGGRIGSGDPEAPLRQEGVQEDRPPQLLGGPPHQRSRDRQGALFLPS